MITGVLDFLEITINTRDFKCINSNSHSWICDSDQKEDAHDPLQVPNLILSGPRLGPN